VNHADQPAVVAAETQQQQQQLSAADMLTSSTFISSSISDCSSHGTVLTLSPVAACNAALPATLDTAAAPQCAWSADAAAAALAEAWCDGSQHSQQQQQLEPLVDRELEFLLELELQRGSSSSSGSDSDAQLMLMLEQELLAAAAEATTYPAAAAGCGLVPAGTPEPSTFPSSHGHHALTSTAPAAVAPLMHQKLFNNASTAQLKMLPISHTAGAFGSFMPAFPFSCAGSVSPQPCAAAPAAVGSWTSSTPSSTGKSYYLQQRLQALQMQYNKLAQLHQMLSAVQGQHAAAAAAGFGSQADSLWLSCM
jgi:hypothetical protein